MQKASLLKFLDKCIGTLTVHCMARPFSVGKPETLRSVLFIRPGGIGDAVLLIPAILAFRERYPGARITVLAEKRNGAVFGLCPAVDYILLYDHPQHLFRAIRAMYDVVIDSEQWHRLSSIVARLTGAPLSIGYATNGRERLFTHRIAYSHDDYEVDSFYNLLTPLGIPKPATFDNNYLIVPEPAKAKAKTLLGNLGTRPFVALFPGASIPERRWGAERFRGVAERLHTEGIPVVVVGGKEDAADGECIISERNGLSLAGKASLAETAAVIEIGTLLISGDTGILHIGVGLGKPTVSLFGPGIVQKWAPRGEKHVVLNRNLPCSPCTKFGYTPKCPNNARCMAEITVGEVAAAVERLWQRAKG